MVAGAVQKEQAKSNNHRSNRKKCLAFRKMHVLDATDYLCWLAGEHDQISDDDARLTVAALIYNTDELERVFPVDIASTIDAILLERQFADERWTNVASKDRLHSQIEDKCVDYVWCVINRDQSNALRSNLRVIESIFDEICNQVSGEGLTVKFSIGRHPYSAYCGLVSESLGNEFAIDGSIQQSPYSAKPK